MVVLAVVELGLTPVEVVARGPPRPLEERHAGLGGRLVGLAQIARRTGRDDVLPVRMAAPRARHDVVESQAAGGQAQAAVLAGEAVAQVDVVAREGGTAPPGPLVLQGADAGGTHPRGRGTRPP